MTVPASVVRVEAGEGKARIEAAGPSLNGRFITYRGAGHAFRWPSPHLPNGSVSTLCSIDEVLPMTIAQIAPLAERCPPRLYGGTERIVSYLTEELGRQGHDVTLFASGDSLTSARLVPICSESLRL